MTRRKVPIVVALVLWCASAQATVPSLVNYQGIVTNPAGVPVPGPHSVVFSLYNAPAGGVLLWSETSPITADVYGRFNVLLGSVTPLHDSLFSGSDRYLGLAVDDDPELIPRVRIASVAYALRSETVDGATGGVVSGNVAISQGNLVLNPSTPTDGNILKGNGLFIHNPGEGNTLVGLNSGSMLLSGGGSNNTAVGENALMSNTSGQGNTAQGHRALISNTAGVGNTASGDSALTSNLTGVNNSAFGSSALYSNTSGRLNVSVGSSALFNNGSGYANTGLGVEALMGNVDGNFNTAVGFRADVSDLSLTNATAIGAHAMVDASNKIRLGNPSVTVLECQVGLTVISDRNEKENFRHLDGQEVLAKVCGIPVSSWNLKGHDPERFRHYGPMAQDFFAAFGNDGAGTIGSPTTINSGDMAGILMISVQALEKRNQELELTVAELKSRLEQLEGK